MSLEFKKIEVNSIQEMLPFYAMRHNMTCDSVFLESYVWKDYYNVRYAIWENKALSSIAANAPGRKTCRGRLRRLRSILMKNWDIRWLSIWRMSMQ